MKQDYKLSALFLLIAGVICVAIGIPLGNAVGDGAFSASPAYTANMWELAGLLVGGGGMIVFISPVVLVIGWYLSKQETKT